MLWTKWVAGLCRVLIKSRHPAISCPLLLGCNHCLHAKELTCQNLELWLLQCIVLPNYNELWWQVLFKGYCLARGGYELVRISKFCPSPSHFFFFVFLCFSWSGMGWTGKLMWQRPSMVHVQFFCFKLCNWVSKLCPSLPHTDPPRPIFF
jgi:hypothetical protein